jgi:hypothetical protein
MSDGATPPVTVAAPPAHANPGPAVPGWPEVLAHLVGGVGIGAVSGFLILWTSPRPEFLVGVPVDGFDIINVAPELVALAAMGLALVARLRPYAWLIAALGLLGFAGLYAQGNRLDGRSLVVGLIVVIALQFGGMLLAFASASGRARWAVAVGLGAGIVAGRDALAWLVDVVRQGPLGGTAHGDDVVFAALGLVVAVAGGVLLGLGRRTTIERAPALVAWWPLVAVAVASLLAVGLTEVWDYVFRNMTMSYLGVISERDLGAIETWDYVVRVGLAVLVAAVLALAANRWGARGTARWVATGLGSALLLAVLQAFLAYRATALVLALGTVGAAAGAYLARRAASMVPWEALGLLLGAGLAVFGPSAGLWPVGWFGFGLAVAAGATGLAGPGAGSPGRSGPDTDQVAPAAGLGLAALLLGYQVVVPASITRIHTGGDLPVVAAGVLLAGAAVVVFFALDRRGAVLARQ